MLGGLPSRNACRQDTGVVVRGWAGMMSVHFGPWPSGVLKRSVNGTEIRVGGATLDAEMDLPNGVQCEPTQPM